MTLEGQTQPGSGEKLSVLRADDGIFLRVAAQVQCQSGSRVGAGAGSPEVNGVVIITFPGFVQDEARGLSASVKGGT